jgi:hypothetical protein
VEGVTAGVDVVKLLFFGAEPLQSHLEAFSSLLDLDFFDFFFFGDLPISLATVSVAVKVLPVSGTVSFSWPT